MAQSSPSMASQLPRVDSPQPIGPASPSTRSETDRLASASPTTIASTDGGDHHLSHRVGGDAIALHTRARHHVAHSGPPRMTQEGPRPPVADHNPFPVTPPGTRAAATPSHTSSTRHHIHDANPSPVSRAGNPATR